MIAQAETDTAPSIERGEPDHEYHDRSEVGASMLEDFRSNRKVYHATHVAKTRPKRAATPAMQFGSLLHLLVLEPDRFADAVAEPMPDYGGICPEDGKKWHRTKGSRHQQLWQEEIDKRAGKICADWMTLQRVTDAANAIKRHPVVATLLAEGESEVSHYWTDEETGLRCKCRVDWLASGFALDIKTAIDPSPVGFARRIVQLGYHRKLAHYLDGLAACHGERMPLVHVAVEPEWPHRVAAYEIDDLDRDDVRLGTTQRRETLRNLADCLARDDWQEPWEKQITSLRLPGWAFSENDYQMGVTDDSSS